MTEKHLKKVNELRRKDHVDESALLTNLESDRILDSTLKVRVFRRRWINLTLFCLCSMSNSFQWIQFAIINNIISSYYDINQSAVDWTSMVYMLAYIPLIFPASWMLNKKGLRFVAILGSLGNCIGAAVKCGSISSDRFPISMLGQTICAVSQLCILGIPARLAAVWFGENEVSLATSLGVFGNQIGVALGFVLTPMIVPNSPSKDVVGQHLSYMFYGVAGITTFVFILIVLFFQKAPPLPPSTAQATITNSASPVKENYLKSIKNLMRNRNFILLLITYGVNVGAYYAIGTLLNQVILSYHKDAETSAGQIGLTIVVAGVLGSIICGVWLDKTHTFKGTTLVVYILSLAGMVIFTISLHLLSENHLWVIYVVAGILGFFMTGYLPIGFEFAAELTYPEPEGTSSGLLNASAQIFGIIFTLGMGAIVTDFQALYGNIAIIISLAVGAILTAFIKSDLRRQNVSQMTIQAKDSEKNLNEIHKNGTSTPQYDGKETRNQLFSCSK